MSEITITTVDGDFEINLTTSELVLGTETISGYGIQGLPGIKGDPGEKGEKGDSASSVADVTGLQDALDAKANVVHYHIVNDITDFDGTVFSGGSF